MGKLKVHKIVFTKDGPFWPCTLVLGHVHIEVTEPMEVRSIKVTVKGHATVCWTETEFEGHHSREKEYKSKEKYLNRFSIVFGGNGNVQIPVGTHKYPFKCTLPGEIPSSFESEVGHVRYSVKSIIDLPWRINPKVKRPFTVNAIMDLNKRPSLKNGLRCSNDKNLCCLCCKSGAITATFRIERKGYVPGEAIKLFAEITNGSNRTMSSSFVDLRWFASFYAGGEKKTKTKLIAQVTGPAIEPHSDDVWNGQKMVIPKTPPSLMPGCKIIDLKYILRLNISPSGAALDLQLPLEVFIGTIPYKTTAQKQGAAGAAKKKTTTTAAQRPSPAATPSAPPAPQANPSAPSTSGSQRVNPTAPSAPSASTSQADVDPPAPPTYEETMAMGNYVINEERTDVIADGDKSTSKGGYQRF